LIVNDDAPYLLLTPGPLTTSPTVKQAMLRDVCTWDREYHSLVTGIRNRLVELAEAAEEYTSVLMQGSGTFCVEATVGSVLPPDGKLLTVDNGAYGRRIAEIARRLDIPCTVIRGPETEPIDVVEIEKELQFDSAITHVAIVHCETTSGLMNPAKEIGALCRRYGKTYILDAMSSFGGVPLSIGEMGAHFLVSSANKCLQGVPGFGFVIARRATLEQTAGWARSLSLDLFDQWREMEAHHGKWRYTSPTHVVRAFAQALRELDAEGGISARAQRYVENHRLLVKGMAELGVAALIAAEHQSPIITAFRYPATREFEFAGFYEAMKARGFVLYPGKLTQADTFRIGTIGHVFADDIRRLLANVAETLYNSS
jgi:2-aminoethylphosphonate-pyruvate transaminase